MEPDGPLCQSCGMPMLKQDEFGTNADGRKNRDYCKFCYQNGSFTEPNATMEQMAEKIVSMSKEMGMNENEARAMANSVLPNLKRWKKG